MEAQAARIVLTLIVVLVGIAALVGIARVALDRMKAHKAAGDASTSDAAAGASTFDTDTEVWSTCPDGTERKLVGRAADKNGFEYACYLMRDGAGSTRMAYCRIVPTTYAFTCPDCGGMIVGVDARRVWPGTAGPEPTAFRCEKCGRQESYDFGVPRVEEREGEPSFEEPQGLQPACPRGGKHAWEDLGTWSEDEFPEGVDPCMENLSLMEEVRYQRWRCARCGEELVERLAG